MKIKYRFIYQQENKNSLGKLFGAQLHGKLLKETNALQRSLEKEFKNLANLYQLIMKDYIEHDEKGSPKVGHDGQLIPKEGKKEAWEAKVNELLDKDFEIKNLNKIDVNQLYNNGLPLSSVDIQNLEPILSGLDFNLEE